MLAQRQERPPKSPRPPIIICRLQSPPIFIRIRITCVQVSGLCMERCTSFSSFLHYPHCSIHVDCNHHVHITVCGWYATWVPCMVFGDSSTVMIFNLKVHGSNGLKLNCLKTQTHPLPSGDKKLFSIIQFSFNMNRKNCSFFLFKENSIGSIDCVGSTL